MYGIFTAEYSQGHRGALRCHSQYRDSRLRSTKRNPGSNPEMGTSRFAYSFIRHRIVHVGRIRVDSLWKSCQGTVSRSRLPNHIFMEKHEPFLNTFTAVITYLLRCNTDTTCLLSGTAIKAALAYITDYVSKNSLSTHTIFSTLKTVFQRSDDILLRDRS